MVFREAMSVVMLSVLASMASAEDRSATAITEVIREQIDAFKADDWQRAYGFASPTIQNIFRSPDIFGQMVRRGYPMVWRPSDLRFGAVDQKGTRLYQRVIVRDAQGVPHTLEYEMVQIGDVWKINGVRLLAPAEVGA